MMTQHDKRNRDKTRNGNPYRQQRRVKYTLRQIQDAIGTTAM